MTGDETNKCKCEHESTWFDRTICMREDGRERMATICDDCGKDIDCLDPVASNTGKHIQCCVECYRNSVKRLAELESAWVKEVDLAHKRIAEQEQQYADLAIEMSFHCEKIASLESSLEGMKKWNEELEKALLQTVYVPAKEYNAMQERIKTAEDKLAATEAYAKHFSHCALNDNDFPCTCGFDEVKERP